MDYKLVEEVDQAMKDIYNEVRQEEINFHNHLV